MTKLLEKAVNAAARLPARRQNPGAAALLEELMRAELLGKLARAEKEIEAGHVVSHAAARQRMKRWLK